MSSIRQLPWLRIGAETVAIVTSILLAFAIDAWWQRRAEAEEAATLIRGLLDDFRASQQHLQDRQIYVNRIREANATFLDILQQAESGQEVTVPFWVVVGVIGAPTYDPTDATLRAASASGRLGLISDPHLRNRLSEWKQLVDDTVEDELLGRQITVGQLVPVLARQIRLTAAFDFDTLVTEYRDAGSALEGDPFELRADSELEGLLAERLFYLQFVVSGYDAIGRIQSEIVTKLESML